MIYSPILALIVFSSLLKQDIDFVGVLFNIARIFFKSHGK